MHPNPRRIVPFVVGLAALGLAGWWLFWGRTAGQDGPLIASGTIEATEININPELGGRVSAVNAAEGDGVKAGAVLIQFDTTLLETQRTQAAAALAAARANYDLLKAGATEFQLTAAQGAVDQTQIAVDAAQEAYDAIPESAQDSTTGKAAKRKLDTAQAALTIAQAQYEALKAGARPEQLTAAQAQVDAAQAALDVLDIQIGKMTLTSPVDGVVLARAIEPGEIASPGATLMVIGQLDDLTITVYVPEDHYGTIRLGQSAQVAVDSYPAQTFTATVSHVAEQAEFTPRNVQTATGRKTTVFAIRLNVSDPEGKLKPGMPADVQFGE